MNFFEDSVLQARKRRHLVCGDYYLCSRTPDATVAVLCDGIGSGVYANVAAITCTNRLMTLLEGGRSLRSACEQVAESMHRARTEEIPFAAFIAVRILPGGQFTAYAYENPGPILIRNGEAQVMEQQFIALTYEIIAESTGILEEGDRLFLCSDGVTHAGLGGGFAAGWGMKGAAEEINAFLRMGGRYDTLLSRVMNTVYHLSGETYWDDTTLAMLTTRPAAELVILTGPPANQMEDKHVVQMFDAAPGKKAICGSTTTDMVARELKRKATLRTMEIAMDRPPEYEMEGIDLITEGAVTLNQVMNLLSENVDLNVSDSPVFRLSKMLLEADRITFLLGGSLNVGQDEDYLFRQLGVEPRRGVVRRLAEHLAKRGKLAFVKRV